ncbi:josephin-1-like [Oppia nitens]|uniref:josephin-1-like n=1 Tax=Oppia nitens TaxID=1686743 RepID=UPI0023DB842A|nr:josephin-1-like [Oppia nitens]
MSSNPVMNGLANDCDSSSAAAMTTKSEQLMANSGIYHEKQCKQMCAKHALNNLLQDVDAFTKSDLDTICQTLSPNTRWLNPHKSSLGLGNYDINVIISALHTKHYETFWFDKRKDPECLVLDNIKGFVLNIPNPIYNSCKKWTTSSLFSLPTSLLSSRKHWIAIRAFGHQYYNLDSKLDCPQLIGNESQLINYLREKNRCNDTEIFVIVSQLIAETEAWIRQQYEE